MMKTHRRILCFVASIGWAGAIAGNGCPMMQDNAVHERASIGIVKNGEDVRLTGLSPLRGWGEGRDNTFMHCLETVLKSLGVEADYDELMGLSGAAFRLQFRREYWDSSNPDPLAGQDCVRPALAAVGFEFETYFPQPGDAADSGRVREAIVASINFGVPVLATNLVPPENWGIITGYRDKGLRWWCRTYDSQPSGSDVMASGWPTAVVILSKRTKRGDARAAHRASVDRAIELFEQSAAGDYSQGQRAFDDWMQMLRRAADRDYLQPNAWTYVSLIDARGSAARYLRRIADEFGGGRPQIEQAAEAYAREREVLLRAAEAVRWPRDVPVGVPEFATRQRQVDALKQAADLERQAVAALRRAR